MKISISASVLNHFSSKFAATALIIATTAEQKGLKGSHGPMDDLLSGLPFFKNIKAEATKIFTVTKGDEEVTIEVNDDYIKGSIDLACNLYERLAAPVTETIRQIKNWESESKAFEKQWSEDSQTAGEKVIGIILEVERQKTAKKTKFEDVSVTITENDNRTIYVGDLDKQIVVQSLTLVREGEDLPYQLNRHSVISICQDQIDPEYYDAGKYEYPISVLNAVRGFYGLPLFLTKEEVQHNKDVAEQIRKEALEKKLAEDKAKRDADRKAKKEQQQSNN